ncbi:hypothetical protein SAMN05421823_10797 [Catalinimonas alkaloidigena]|uniref:PKD domain-containing protein n=1 Tax=Catalinimonas alkaloidigena TaxID=1075417 RepID=A0A1G9LMB6_9BACT|nr:PKD domain-containing protein [Catalinimonas alkaloidigena]SDL63048.1 hypothetical protein SAMN05421823_10797 [Catalinimonas alkaloidigena]
MKRIFSFPLLLLALLAACTEKPDPTPQTSVTANAGADQTAAQGTTVTLDGRASKDSENRTLTYLWSFTKKPAGSVATLTNPTTAQPTFVGDLPGEYEAELTVTNPDNQAAKDKVVVTVTDASTAPTELEGTYETDLHLVDRVSDPNLPDYFMKGDVLMQAKLTIDPGVTIQVVADKYLSIEENGSLVANGTADKKIVFVGKEATAGSWRGITVKSASALNSLDYAEIRHAGGKNIPGIGSTLPASLALYPFGSPSLSLKNTLITDGKGYGMLVFQNTTLAAFEKNQFRNLAGTSLYLTINQLGKLDAASSFTGGNGFDGIEIFGNMEEGQEEAVWPAFSDGSKYLISEDLNVKSGLRIEPGATFEFKADKMLLVDDNGYLIAKGTADKHITFSGRNKTAGFWRGILVRSTSSLNELNYVDLEYAGGKNFPGIGSDYPTALSLYNFTKSHLKLAHTTIAHSGGYGMFIPLGSVLEQFEANTIHHSAKSALLTDAQNVGMLDAASQFKGSNGYDGVEIYASKANEENAADATWPAFTDGASYLVTGDVIINKAVTIQPGAVFEFAADRYLEITPEGSLVAKGTAAQQIVFTGKNRTKGYWRGILVRSSSPLNELTHAEVSYGGSKNFPGFGSDLLANIGLYGFAQAQLKVSNSKISDSKGWGIIVQQNCTLTSDATVTFANNTSGSIQE